MRLGFSGTCDSTGLDAKRGIGPIGNIMWSEGEGLLVTVNTPQKQSLTRLSRNHQGSFLINWSFKYPMEMTCQINVLSHVWNGIPASWAVLYP